MSRMLNKIAPDWDQKIKDLLSELYGLAPEGAGADSKLVASYIQRMSDHYIAHPDSPTPWNEKWAAIAQLAYYFPLNLLRWNYLLSQIDHTGLLSDVDDIVDFGAGLSPTLAAFRQAGYQGKATFIEQAPRAIELARKLGAEFSLSDRHHPQKGKHAVLCFSYSITEMVEVPDWILDYDTLMVIEPSTQTDGRKLMELRKQLVAKGYHVLAPCVHNDICPQLTHPHDWCHTRFHVSLPSWMLQIEKHLPFQNPTLTMSYLVITRRAQYTALPNKWRLVGDLLKEKGKARQMVCRGPNREFLAWLSRNGSPPDLERGILIDQPHEADYKVVSNEIRFLK
jgi:hypothetical protein